MIETRRVLDLAFVSLIAGCPIIADTVQTKAPVANTDTDSHGSAWKIVDYECPSFTEGFDPPPTGQLPEGGGEILITCAQLTDVDGDGIEELVVNGMKHENDTGAREFGDRPYQVRNIVNGGEEDCGPHSYDQPIVSVVQPEGIGTDQITFTIPMDRLGGNTANLCITASVKEGDLGHNPDVPEQEAWWYSDDITLKHN